MHSVLWIKFGLASIALLVCVGLVFARSPSLERSTPPWLIVAYYVARLLVLAFAFFVLHFKYQGENTPVFLYWGNLVLQGQVPNRDFLTCYGILFSYVLAGGLFVWHEPFVLYIVLQTAELAAVFAIFTQKNLPLTLRSFLGYALNPLTLICVWLAVENQILCLIPIAALVAVRSDTGRSIWFALGFSFSKLFALWTIIPALAFQRIRSILVFGALLLLIYGPFMLVGAEPVSLKSTQADGAVADDAMNLGVENLIRYLPADVQVKVGHWSLRATEAALLAVLGAPWWMRWKMGEAKIADPMGFEAKLVYSSILAVLLMLIFQAFATYTVPEYLITVVALTPILVKSGFWSKGDQVFFLVVVYLQAIVALYWFHFAEFGNQDPTTSAVYTVGAIMENMCMVSFCLLFLWKTVRFFRREDWRSGPWSSEAGVALSSASRP